MQSIGVRGKVLGWVREWLTGRTQKVVLNGKESGLGDVRSGVVQGSSLGPTLFLIYINDISSAVTEGESALDLTSSILSLFADDSTKWGRCVDTLEDTKRRYQQVGTMEQNLADAVQHQQMQSHASWEERQSRSCLQDGGH